MICTSVVPCLSSGLAKNNKIMSMFVLFSWVFGHLEDWLFFKNGGETSHQSSHTVRFNQFFETTMNQ